MSKNVCFQHRFERAVRKRLAASGGGHTLRCHDLGMILAWRRSGVSDGGHSADVMKKVRGQIAEVRTPAAGHFSKGARSGAPPVISVDVSRANLVILPT